MGNLRNLEEAIVAFRDARDWKQFHSAKDLALSLCIEAGELAEFFQWKTEEQCRKRIEEKREEIGDELADVLFILLLLAHDLGIDLNEAAKRKLRKNEMKYPAEIVRGSNMKYTEYPTE